jgi:hypothetical protein
MDADMILKLDNIDAGIQMLERRMVVIEDHMRRVIDALNESAKAYNELLDVLATEKDEAETEYDLSGNAYPASRN